MDSFTPSDLKTILHSKRANLYYLEHCRVLVNGGRVEYVTDEGKQSLYWNIPIANTTSLLLGTGTSITQAAMRELAKAGCWSDSAAVAVRRCSRRPNLADTDHPAGSGDAASPAAQNGAQEYGGRVSLDS
nr:hypothetical protein [Allochromatium palmeri]